MFPQFASGHAVSSGVRTFPLLTMLCVSALLAGCSAPPLPIAGANPADPSSPVPGVGYRSTTAGYRRQRPVDPAPWIEQNQRVAPNPGSKQ